MSKYLNGGISSVRIRQNTSFARGTTIDEYLQEADNAALYEKWSPEWEDKLEFPGKIYAITAEMIVDVPETEFVKVLGRTRGPRIYKIAKETASSY